jgi:hypothetical protein
VIEDMDQSGVRAGILSLASTPGVWFDVGSAEAGRLARRNSVVSGDEWQRDEISHLGHGSFRHPV